MIRAARIEAVRSRHQAALDLTLACAERVGATVMAVAMPTVPVLGEPVPRRLRRDVSKIEKGGKS